MKHFSFVLGLMCALVLLSIPAHAESLSIATFEEPPYGFLEKNCPTGMAFEVGNAIAGEAGFTSTNVLIPLPQAVDALNNGEVSMALLPDGVAAAASVENLGPVFSTRFVVVGRAGNYFRSLRELKGRTVAVVRGAEQNEHISKKNGIVPYPVADYSQGLKLLLANRVDALAGIDGGIGYAVKQGNLPGQALGDPLLLSEKTVSLFISRGAMTGLVRREVGESLKRIEVNGQLGKILANYSL